MQTYKPRKKVELINKHLKAFPCVALLGARQVGKSTLAKEIIKNIDHSIYLDLQDPRDKAKLQDPLTFLEANEDSLICIDEIQLYPDLFTVLRGYIDNNKRPGQLLILGSASRDLIKQSSETLAGRISYIEICPFVAQEVEDHKKLWLQGGYPDSYLFNEELSFDWRINYIRTFLERDIPQLGFNIPAETLKRFWMMLAHTNGTILNQSSLASSMGVSVPTVRKYLDLLEGTFVIRKLRPFHTNTKKRLIKSPKVYIRDSGLIHCLLNIESYNDLLGHPALGNSFETHIIESLLIKFNRYRPFFYRSSSGNEIDLVLIRGQEIIAIEIKASSSPSLTRGFYEALAVIKPTRKFVIAQIDKGYPLKGDLWVYSLKEVLEESFK